MMFQLTEIIQLQHLIYYDQVVSVVEKSAVGGHPLDSLDMSKSYTSLIIYVVILRYFATRATWMW